MLIDSALPGSRDFLRRVLHTREACRAWLGCLQWRSRDSRACAASLSAVALARLSRVCCISRACCLFSAPAQLKHALLLQAEVYTQDKSCALKPGFSTEPPVSVSVTDRNGSLRFGASLCLAARPGKKGRSWLRMRREKTGHRHAVTVRHAARRRAAAQSSEVGTIFIFTGRFTLKLLAQD